MSTVTTKDGVQIFYKTGVTANPSVSIMAGRSARTTGIRRCCSSSSKGIVSWESIVAGPRAFEPGVGRPRYRPLCR
jgi:hypothetical protein